MRRSNYVLYLLIVLFIIALDQITKILIVKNLLENEAVSVIGDLFYFRFIYNEGGALGTSFGPSWLYMLLTLLALVLIVRYFVTAQPDGALIKSSLALILGGAVGNLVDRFAYGKVVDFIDIDFPDISVLGIYRWYTFNIADAAISAGLVLFVISVFIPRKMPTETSELAPGIGSPDPQESSPASQQGQTGSPPEIRGELKGESS